MVGGLWIAATAEEVGVGTSGGRPVGTTVEKGFGVPVGTSGIAGFQSKDLPPNQQQNVVCM